ncbi:MAG TPA: pyocin, partial [Pseudomonas sp.]|nr:pyocin [Pseudomonas sp.]
MKKLGFPDTPDSIPSSAPDPVQIARKTKEAQEAHARAVAANERNEQAAEARWRAIQEREEAPRVGYVFAKSCALPDGMINHNNSRGFVPLESLQQYGMYGVLASAGAVSPLGTPLSWVGGSGSASAVAKRLMGQVAVRAPLPVKVVVAVLMPNTTSADSAFYSSEQYAELTKGNTRA